MSNKGLEIVSEIGEGLTLGDNDIKEIMEVRKMVLECLLRKQDAVDQDGVVWAELEGIIDLVVNMYDPVNFEEGSNQWH